jgi:hypothetical protein
MNTCEATGCPGHLGKFDSCRDEALWSMSLDTFGDDTTGDTEYDGYYVRVLVDGPEDVDVDGRKITVPAGKYIVRTAPAGFVTVTEYDTDKEVNDAFGDVRAAYEEWVGQDED